MQSKYYLQVFGRTVANPTHLGKALMASFVRLSIAAICCVQLALGNLPAVLHQSACSCSQVIADKGPVSNSAEEVCTLSCCHTHRQHAADSRDASAKVPVSDHKQPQAPHDSEHCAICQFLTAQFAPAPSVDVSQSSICPIQELDCTYAAIIAISDLKLSCPRGPPC